MKNSLKSVRGSIIIYTEKNISIRDNKYKKIFSKVSINFFLNTLKRKFSEYLDLKTITIIDLSEPSVCALYSSPITFLTS